MAIPSEFELAYFKKHEAEIFFWAEQRMLDTDLINAEDSPYNKLPPIFTQFVWPLASKLSWERSRKK